jgi:hypothetical protein
VKHLYPANLRFFVDRNSSPVRARCSSGRISSRAAHSVGSLTPPLSHSPVSLAAAPLETMPTGRLALHANRYLTQSFSAFRIFTPVYADFARNDQCFVQNLRLSASIGGFQEPKSKSAKVQLNILIMDWRPEPGPLRRMGPRTAVLADRKPAMRSGRYPARWAR